MIRDKIKKDLSSAIEKATGKKPEGISINQPVNPKHGDYTSNWAIIQKRKDALLLSQKVVDAFSKKDYLKKVEVMKPGFINFHLSPIYLQKQLNKILKEKDKYGQGKWGKNQKALVEYSSPNIAKEFSVGHLRSTIVGQAIRNLYDFSGWKTIGDNHLGDWGTQFGMIIAGIQEKELNISDMNVSELEKLYVKYNKKVQKDKIYLEKAREAFAQLEKGDKKARKIWKQAVKVSMIEFKRIYKLLGIEIENAYGESFYENLTKDVIKEMKAKGIAEKGEKGAWIVKYKELPPAMLVKSDGSTTYFTRDMATIKFRMKSPDLKSDLYIYEVGAEQKLHFEQVFKAAEMMGWGDKSKFIHIAHGLILGKDKKKLSTRRGTSQKLENWLTEIINKAKEINSKTAEKVGLGALKYMDLKHKPSKSYIFDMEKALSLEGNSGPYLQYTYARAKSILRKARIKNELRIMNYELGTEELNLTRELRRFPEIIKDSTKTYNPALVCNYLFALAQKFNLFYETCPVLTAEEKIKKQRLALMQAVAQVIKNGLSLLGIEVMEEM